MDLPETILKRVLVFQRTEITEHYIYKRLAKKIKSPENARILDKIADDEIGHYQGWKKYSGREISPDRGKMWLYYWISRLFGFTFGVKLMERGEEAAQKNYAEISAAIPEAEQFLRDEDLHEEKLMAMLDEDLLRYVGSIILGLNDALVELTGGVAGLTLALQNTKLIALSGSITGFAAALSMAASEFLSTRSEGGQRQPLKAALYTGISYIITVILLILPYLLMSNYFICLVIALAAAVLIIAAFNYYISVAKNEPFRSRFWEMTLMSFGVAALSFGLGYLIRTVLKVQI